MSFIKIEKLIYAREKYMTDLLIADDQPIVRIGLTYLLSQERDINIIGEASNSKEMFELLQQQTFDLLVINVSMAIQDGCKVLEQLRKRYSDTPVLVLSKYSEHHHALRPLELGVKGYLDKAVIPKEFVKAVRNISKGGKYINEARANELAFLVGKKTSQHKTLSKREFQILCLIASNKTQKDISTNLCISEKTVSTHKSRVLQKLNLTGDAELIRYAIENNLIEF
jgi:DNA-binding NarL/FixJ family response regulator